MQRAYELSESSGSIMMLQAPNCPHCKNLAGKPFSLLHDIDAEVSDKINRSKYPYREAPAVSADGTVQ